MRFHYGLLSFLLLLTLPLLGCDIFNKGEDMLVRNLDAVILTANDLPTMKEGVTTDSHRIGGHAKSPPIVEGFEQSWDGTRPEERIKVRYWLFRSTSDAKKAAEEWRGLIASGAIVINGKMDAIYQPEPKPKDVIGDATWRTPDGASLWFVKNNVLVHVRDRTLSHSQLTLTRSVARKIETKIKNALK